MIWSQVAVEASKLACQLSELVLILAILIAWPEGLACPCIALKSSAVVEMLTVDVPVPGVDCPVGVGDEDVEGVRDDDIDSTVNCTLIVCVPSCVEKTRKLV